MNTGKVFTTDIILSSDMVEMRPLRANDIDHLLQFAIEEPELWHFSMISAAGEDALKNYIQLALEAKKQEKEYPFIIFDKRAHTYAGSTRFYDIQFSTKTLQLGYTWYGKQFQGSGLNTHCKFLLLEFAFESWNMERVEFRADVNNTKSIRAMEKIGCIKEGILRSNAIKPDGSRRDSIVLSILKDEWFKNVKSALIKQMV